MVDRLREESRKFNDMYEALTAILKDQDAEALPEIKSQYRKKLDEITKEWLLEEREDSEGYEMTLDCLKIEGFVTFYAYSRLALANDVLHHLCSISALELAQAEIVKLWIDECTEAMDKLDSLVVPVSLAICGVTGLNHIQKYYEKNSEQVKTAIADYRACQPLLAKLAALACIITLRE